MRCLMTTAGLLLLLCGSACTTPIQRNLVAPEAPSAHMTQQPLSLRVMPPRISIPANEIAGQSSRTHLFLFLGIFAYFDSRGSLLPEAKYYAQDLGGEVQATLVRTLADSGLFQNVTSGPADLELHSEVLHLYGANYNKGAGFATYGGGWNTRRKYLPYGTAVLRFLLVDTRGGHKRIVWDTTLNGSYIPDAEDAELANKEIENAATLAAVAAYRDLLSQLPPQLTRVASRLGGRASGRPLPSDTCYLARLLPDARYLERAAVSARSGQVLHSEILIRKEPIFSAPNEWVLDPYQGGHELFDEASYDRLAQRLTPTIPLKRLATARLWSLETQSLRHAAARASSAAE